MHARQHQRARALRAASLVALAGALLMHTSFSGSAAAVRSRGLPALKILATGGTIAGAQAGSSSYGYKAGSFNVNDLIKAVPDVDKVATLSGEQVANIGSQDMNDEVWLKLAKRANEVLRDDAVDGVVITHGTDTMEET